MIPVVLPPNWSKKFRPGEFYAWARQQGIKRDDWKFETDGGVPTHSAIYFKKGVDALAFKIRFDI
jgi:hypothetical protein